MKIKHFYLLSFLISYLSFAGNHNVLAIILSIVFFALWENQAKLDNTFIKTLRTISIILVLLSLAMLYSNNGKPSMIYSAIEAVCWLICLIYTLIKLKKENKIN